MGGGPAGAGVKVLMRAQYVCTTLLAASIVLYCCFTAFSIGVIDVNNHTLREESQRPPWPRLPSSFSARRWRSLQSSSTVAPHLHPVRPGVVPAEVALQGMGTLFRKGTRPMRELIVAHLSEETSLGSLGLFLRTLHRSGATARADVVFLFPGASTSQRELRAVFRDEEASFQLLLALSDPEVASKQGNASSGTANSTLSPFNAAAFKRAEEEQHVRGDVIWGNRSRPGSSNPTAWAGYGSIVGFEMQDLDPHNTLAGFFDNPPAQLRRWLCYEMLLGMVRTKYRNVLLTQVKGVLFVGDALAAIRRRQYLYLTSEDRSWLDLDAEEPLEIPEHRHRRSMLSEHEEDEDAKDTDDEANPDARTRQKQQRKPKTNPDEFGKGLIPSVYGNEMWRSLDKAHRDRVVVSSSFAMGRIEHVRKLSNKMATEIVRIALHSNSHRSFHDKAVLNYLVHQSSVLGKRVLEHVKIAANKDSVVHSLEGSKQPHAFWKRRAGKSNAGYAIVQGLSPNSPPAAERGRKIVAALLTDICRSAGEKRVYRDCSPTFAASEVL